jgi:hypothetical protein
LYNSHHITKHHWYSESVCKYTCNLVIAKVD